ncbi:MAG TPA: flagellar export protein FliJ [Hyphomicrobiaceae bacterium]|nr:flagellar export protein FliJ [Hyphomicrobiaceae bacterium]
MRSREALLRSKRFEAEEKARKVEALEQMIREFEQMASDLQRQVQAEEERTGIRDRSHFAYSTFAKAASLRHENLLASIAGLKSQLAHAVRERDEARADIAASEAAEALDADRGRRRADRLTGLSLR